MIFSDEDYHDRNAIRQLICDCVNALSASQNVNDMLCRGIKLINIMLDHEQEVQKGHKKRLLDIRQIASELHVGGGNAAATADFNFVEMTGSLELDMLLQPFEDSYASYPY
jgi:hypothetical protein